MADILKIVLYLLVNKWYHFFSYNSQFLGEFFVWQTVGKSDL
jgi:hypothetical protein